ncbi:MAG: hypothetical protein R3B48_18565 [Kofleriaceae bacterium]
MTQPVAVILLGSGDRALLRRSQAAMRDAPSPLAALVQRLTLAGIEVTSVSDLEEAKSVAALRDHPPRAQLAAMDDSGAVHAAPTVESVTPILIDLEHCSGDDPEDVETAHRAIADCRHAFSGQGPIAVTSNAPARLLLECFRSGAADIIDLRHEGTARARATVLRCVQRERLRRAEVQLSLELRGLLDELVRDLVRTERRTIDLERRLGGADVEQDQRVYLERIKARHEQLLARYLGLKQGP